MTETEALAELEPGTAELDEARLRFQVYRIGIGQCADDSSPAYRRAFPPPVWAPAGFPFGFWCSWSRSRGTRFLLHRAPDGDQAWPLDPQMWRWPEAA